MKDIYNPFSMREIIDGGLRAYTKRKKQKRTIRTREDILKATKEFLERGGKIRKGEDIKPKTKLEMKEINLMRKKTWKNS